MEQIKLLLNENIKFVIICGVAYSLDFVTGFSKAIFLKNVQSNKLKKSVMKGIAYFSFIIIGACLELLFPSKPITMFETEIYLYWKIQIICLGIALTDFYSVYENMKEYGNIPFVEKILNYFRKEVDEQFVTYIPDMDSFDYEKELMKGDDEEDE